MTALCWRAGRVVLGDVGQQLVRSIVDVAVASEERLVFEGEPILKPPLVQDPDVRKPVAYDGKIVDTKKAIPACRGRSGSNSTS